MNSSPIERRVLLDISAILDMRLGALKSMDAFHGTELAIQVISDPNYYVREVDEIGTPDMGYLPIDKILEIQKHYTAECIAHAFETPLLSLVKETLYKHFGSAPDNPVSSPLVIDINLYPAELDDDTKEQLKVEITQLLMLPYEIEIHSCPFTQFDMTRVALLCIYDFKEFAQTHQALIESGALSDTLIYTPKVNRVRAFTIEERRQLAQYSRDPFTEMEKASSHLFKLMFLPIRVFCASSPLNQEDALIQAIKEQRHEEPQESVLVGRAKTHQAFRTDGVLRIRPRR